MPKPILGSMKTTQGDVLTPLTGLAEGTLMIGVSGLVLVTSIVPVVVSPAISTSFDQVCSSNAPHELQDEGAELRFTAEVNFLGHASIIIGGE